MKKSILGAKVAAGFALMTALFASTAAYADITVYSAGPGSLIEKLATGFTAKTGSWPASRPKPPIRWWTC
jgi:iron(III) transport system substrate-binding protein